MKNLFALLLALCLCLAVSAACAGEEPLRVWAIESPQLTDYATNGQSRWMEETTGIKAVYTSVPRNGWYAAFQASVMAGDPIDVYCYEFDTSEASMLGTDMQYIIPLEPYITAENTPNIHAILEADPALRSLITAPDGHIYTLFTNGAYDLAAYKHKLWVNRFFLEKYEAETGCGMPRTTQAFEEMLRYFASHDMNGDGEINEIPYIGQSGVDGFATLFGAFVPSNTANGYGFYEKDGALRFAFREDAFKDALAWLSGLYGQGLISPDTFTISPEERYAYTSGSKSAVRAGVVVGVNAAQVVQLSGEPDAMTYADYVALPPLTGPDGECTVITAGETLVSLRNAITVNCKDPAAAMRWLDAGYSEAARLYAAYGGVENEDWAYAGGENLAGSGRVIVSLRDAGENATWNGSGIVSRITEADYLAMDVKTLPQSDALATYRANLAYRPYAQQSVWPAIVWPGAYTEEAAQYGEINKLVQNAVSAYYTDVVLGRRDTGADWDAYIAELDAMGFDRLHALTALYCGLDDAAQP